MDKVIFKIHILNGTLIKRIEKESTVWLKSTQKVQKTMHTTFKLKIKNEKLKIVKSVKKRFYLMFLLAAGSFSLLISNQFKFLKLFELHEQKYFNISRPQNLNDSTVLVFLIFYKLCERQNS